MEDNENNKINDNTKIEIDQMKKIISFLCMFMCETLAKRIVSMILLLAGMPNARVTELVNLCDRSVRSLKKDLRTKEIESLFIVKGGGQKAKLNDIETEVIEEIEKNNYTTRQQISDMIWEKYGIKVSVWAVGRMLKKNKIKKLKSGSLPAKANTQEQRNFFDNILNRLMEKALNGEIILEFMDGSHFIMGCDFLGSIYGKIRRFVKTFSGRKRYNVLGALNFVTKKVTTVSNDAYINGVEVCNLLRKLATEYVGQAIYVILDNARYQKCKIVQELAEQLGITLVYIPPYSQI